MQCVPGTWSEWSTECGKATRTRIINSVPKIEKRESCEGLTLTCPSSEETETRSKKCKKINYCDIKYAMHWNTTLEILCNSITTQAKKQYHLGKKEVRIK